jgi:CDP-paratose 2-epimerase
MALKILITGGCGFVGSNLSIFFKQLYPESEIIAFDNLKRRGSELNISRFKAAGVEFIHGDIRNKEDFDGIGKVDFVIDAAAEPSVMAGLDAAPDYVINTNLNGTVNCLNFAVKNNAGFIFLSSSRIYPFVKLDDSNYVEQATRFSYTDAQVISGVSSMGITTEFPLTGPRSFYGATKLASELLIAEYAEFIGLKTVINRCGVITGPWQMGKVDQGVIVLWMARHFWKKNLTYNGYGGKGKQVRDILHVHDLFRLIDYQMLHIDQFSGKTFNVGGGNDCSVSLIELTKICEKLTGNEISITSLPENRKADVRIYTTDNSEISKLTGWKPEYYPEKIMQEIYDWIIANESQLKTILD